MVQIMNTQAKVAVNTNTQRRLKSELDNRVVKEKYSLDELWV